MKYITIGAAALAMSLTACDVNQTSQGELPEVDIDVSGESGAMPSFNVNWADVDVGTRTKTVEVPNLVVVMEKKEVEVPVLDVNMPGEAGSNKAERTVVVEAELEGEMRSLKIERVYANQNRLMVVSRLKSTGEPLEDNRVRVSDRLVLNAPENLSVQHIIIGERPQGDWNNQYVFVANDAAAKQRTKGSTEIFSR